MRGSIGKGDEMAAGGVEADRIGLGEWDADGGAGNGVVEDGVAAGDLQEREVLVRADGEDIDMEEWVAGGSAVGGVAKLDRRRVALDDDEEAAVVTEGDVEDATAKGDGFADGGAGEVCEDGLIVREEGDGEAASAVRAFDLEAREAVEGCGWRDEFVGCAVDEAGDAGAIDEEE